MPGPSFVCSGGSAAASDAIGGVKSETLQDATLLVNLQFACPVFADCFDLADIRIVVRHRERLHSRSNIFSLF